MEPLEVSPFAYSRRGLPLLNREDSATGHPPVDRSEVWGGTPANTSICRSPALWTGRQWWLMAFIALSLVALYGILAFVMWGILSVDLPRLTVWNRTGDERRRTFAGNVLKVRNRPNWLLLSLVAVSVAIAEVLPILWSHLFMAGSVPSYVMTNIVIFVSQVGPTFVMPMFHLEISGRFTWLVRLVMWLSAPVTVVPAYALRRFKKWRKRGQHTYMDGLLPLDELVEYIHLHEKGQGYGGKLDNRVGEAIRILMEEQISSEASSRHVETERSWSIQSSQSDTPTHVQSLHPQEPMAVDAGGNTEPTGIRPHRQEGSTAIEDVPATGLRKRGERSIEGLEPAVPVTQVPQQAFIKDPVHVSTLSHDRYVTQDALKVLALQRDFPLQTLNNLVTPRRHRLSMLELYRNERKENGLSTDSVFLEQTR